MGEVYDFFLSSYSDYSRVDIILEFLAFWFGIISVVYAKKQNILVYPTCLLYTSPSPRDISGSRMPSSA